MWRFPGPHECRVNMASYPVQGVFLPIRPDATNQTEPQMTTHATETPRTVPSARIQYDFDEIIDRTKGSSMKWSAGCQLLSADACAADPLPMWVADMDFKAPAPVLDALREAVDHGVFGYPSGASPSYLDAIVHWQARRFGWDVAKDWIIQTPGVIATLKTAVQTFSAPGDSVLIQPPVYSHFHNDVLINGRHLAFAPLRRTEAGYAFDAQVFEAAIQSHTKLFILSNPHNPTGNVWSEAELRTMGEICLRHEVLVISDEIHQDLIMHPGKKHIPFASLGDAFAANSITCTAPSKTFNLAGLQSANVFVPNPKLRDALRRQIDRNMSSWVNTLGLVAAEAAYTHGEPWLEQMLAYVRANQLHFASTVNGMTSKVKVLPADALYLAWMDCRALGMDAEELDRFMLTQARLWLDKGQKFGLEGHGYMRVNLGCPRATVDLALARLASALEGL